MGGMGSGQRGGRDLTDNFRRLDVLALHRAGVLEPGQVRRWCWMQRGVVTSEIIVEAHKAALLLSYQTKHQGQIKSFAYPVSLVSTPCTFGGTRPWFLCPRCGRRVAVLYGREMFLCRHCRGLAYRSQRETENRRVIRRADAIRRRLGWPQGVLNPTGEKPKGMRLRTFLRLFEEYVDLAQIGLEGIQQELGAVNDRLARTILAATVSASDE